MSNRVQKYAWGKPENQSLVFSLAQNATPSVYTPNVTNPQPYAELWMGTHPSAPSRVISQRSSPISTSQPSKEQFPVQPGSSSPFLYTTPTHNHHLSISTTKHLTTSQIESLPLLQSHINQTLPFLFKILSINEALSIQSHPDKTLAQQLHKEQPENYKDDNHKPELVVAVTTMRVLCGFRTLPQILALFRQLPDFSSVFSTLLAKHFPQLELSQISPDHISTLPSTTQDSLLRALWAEFHLFNIQQPDQVKALISSFRDKYSHLSGEYQSSIKSPITTDLSDLRYTILPLIFELSTLYPNDLAIFSPLFLHYFSINPGESIFLGPNEPHAYLYGDCLEIMACSDNVIRAGLTPKYRDVNSLLSSLTYNTSSHPFISNGTVINDDGGVVTTTLYQPPQSFPEFALLGTKIVPYFVDDVTNSMDDIMTVLPTLDGHSLLLLLDGSAELLIDWEGSSREVTGGGDGADGNQTHLAMTCQVEAGSVLFVPEFAHITVKTATPCKFYQAVHNIPLDALLEMNDYQRLDSSQSAGATTFVLDQDMYEDEDADEDEDFEGTLDYRLSHGNGNSFLIIDARSRDVFQHLYPQSSLSNPPPQITGSEKQCRNTPGLYCKYLTNPLPVSTVLSMVSNFGYYIPEPLSTQLTPTTFELANPGQRPIAKSRIVDGLVLVLPSHHFTCPCVDLHDNLTQFDSEKRAFTMFIYNNDGKQTEMCGNALRCAVGTVARIDEFNNSPTQQTAFTIDNISLSSQHDFTVYTLSGPKQAQVLPSVSPLSSQNLIEPIISTINMGIPLFHPSEIPTTLRPNHFLVPSLPSSSCIPPTSRSQPSPLIINAPIKCELTLQSLVIFFNHTASTLQPSSPSVQKAISDLIQESSSKPFTKTHPLHSVFEFLTNYNYLTSVVNTGVPHAIFFIEDSEQPLPERVIVKGLFETVWDLMSFFFPPLGYSFTTHSTFPAQINTEFVRYGVHKGDLSKDSRDNDLFLFETLVNERGCGVTMSCGTGCVATAICAILTGKIPHPILTPAAPAQLHFGKAAVDTQVALKEPLMIVRMPGGDLTISWPVRADGITFTVVPIEPNEPSACNTFNNQPTIQPPVAFMSGTSVFIRGGKM